jgi:hypothetical protein
MLSSRSLLLAVVLAVQLSQTGADDATVDGIKHTKFNVQVNVKAMIQRILSRYPSKYAMFREMIQNANDAGANEITFDFRNSCDAGMWTYFKNDPCLVISDDGSGFTEAAWTRLRTIASGNPDPNKVGGFGVGFYSVFSVTDEPIVKSGGSELDFKWKDEKLIIDRTNDKSFSGTTKGSMFTLPLRNATGTYEEHDTPEFLGFLTRSLSFTKSLTRIKVKGLPNYPSFVTSKETVSSTTAVLPPKYQYQPTLHSVFGFQRDTRRTRVLVKSSFVGKTGIVSDSQSEFMVADAEVDVLHFGKTNSFTSYIYRQTGKKSMPQTVRVEMLYPLSNQQFNKSACTRKTFVQCAFALGQAYSGKVFVGFETSQTTGSSYHVNGPFYATMDRDSLEAGDSPLGVYNLDVLWIGGVLARVIFDEEMKDLLPAPIPLPLDGTELPQLQYAINAVKTFTIKQSWPKALVATAGESGFWHHCTGKGKECRVLIPCIKSTVDFSTSADSSFTTSASVTASASLCNGDEAVVAPHISGKPSWLYVAKSYVPDQIMANCADFVAKMKAHSLLPDLTQENMVEGMLQYQPMHNQFATEYLQWLLQTTQQQSSKRALILDPSVLGAVFKKMMVCSNDTKLQCSGELGKATKFASAKYRNLPLPPNVLPADFSEMVSSALTARVMSSAFALEPLAFPEWWAFVIANDGQALKALVEDTQAAFAFIKFLSSPTVRAHLNPETYKQLRGLRCLPSADGKLRKPTQVYFKDVKSTTPLPMVHPDLTDKYKVSERFLKELGVRSRVHVEAIVSSLEEDITFDAADQILTTFVNMQAGFTEDEWEYLKKTPFMIRKAHNEEGTTSKAVEASTLYLPTSENIGLGLPTPYFPSYSNFSASEAMLTRFGVKSNAKLAELIDIIASEATSETQRDFALNFLNDNLSGKYRIERHVKGVFDVAFMPTDKGLQVPTASFLEPNPLGFPVVTDPYKMLALSLGGVNEEPELAAAATRAISVLKGEEPYSAVVSKDIATMMRAVSVLKGEPYSKVVSKDIATVIFKYMSTRRKKDHQHWDSLNLTAAFRDAEIVPQGAGAKVSPAEAFVGSKSMLQLVLADSKPKWWDAAAVEEATSEMWALGIIVDFDEDANEFLAKCGASVLGDARLGAFFGQLVLNHAVTLHKTQSTFCSAINAFLRNPDVGLMDQLTDAKVVVGLDRHSQLKAKMIKASQCYFQDSKDALLELTNPRYLCPPDMLKLCQEGYEELGSRSLSDAIVTKPHGDITETKGVVNDATQQFEDSIWIRKTLVHYALGQKLKYSTSKEKMSEILDGAQSIMQTIEVRHADELKQEVWFEERLLTVEDTSALFDQDQMRILISSENADLSPISFQLAHAMVLTNWDNFKFKRQGAFGMTRDFAQTIHFVLESSLDTLGQMHYPTHDALQDLKTREGQRQKERAIIEEAAKVKAEARAAEKAEQDKKKAEEEAAAAELKAKEEEAAKEAAAAELKAKEEEAAKEAAAAAELKAKEEEAEAAAAELKAGLLKAKEEEAAAAKEAEALRVANEKRQAAEDEGRKWEAEEAQKALKAKETKEQQEAEEAEKAARQARWEAEEPARQDELNKQAADEKARAAETKDKSAPEPTADEAPQANGDAQAEAEQNDEAEKAKANQEARKLAERAEEEKAFEKAEEAGELRAQEKAAAAREAAEKAAAEQEAEEAKLLEAQKEAAAEKKAIKQAKQAAAEEAKLLEAKQAKQAREKVKAEKLKAFREEAAKKAEAQKAIDTAKKAKEEEQNAEFQKQQLLDQLLLETSELPPGTTLTLDAFKNRLESRDLPFTMVYLSAANREGAEALPIYKKFKQIGFEILLIYADEGGYASLGEQVLSVTPEYNGCSIISADRVSISDIQNEMEEMRVEKERVEEALLQEVEKKRMEKVLREEKAKQQRERQVEKKKKEAEKRKREEAANPTPEPEPEPEPEPTPPPTPPPPPVDCKVSSWKVWSQCSKSCGGGTKTRHRTVVTQMDRNGAACPKLQQNKPCGTKDCPPEEFKNGVLEYSAETENEIHSSEHKVHLVVFVDKFADSFKGIRAAVEAVAELHGDSLLHIVAHKTQSSVMNYFGVTESQLPTAVITNMTGELTSYQFDKTANMNQKNLAGFVESVLDGTAQELIKSAEKPKSDFENALRVVVGSTFKHVVMDNKDDVLLLAYEPTSAQSQAAIKVFEQFAKSFFAGAGITLAKIDGSANAINHPAVEVDAYPTWLFFKGNDKSTVATAPAFGLPGAIGEFLQSSASNPYVPKPDKKPTEAAKAKKPVSEAPAADISSKDARKAPELNAAQAQTFAEWVGTILHDKVGDVSLTSPVATKVPATIQQRAVVGADGAVKNELALELNAGSTIIRKIASLRQKKPKLAVLIAEQILDNALMSAGLLTNTKPMLARMDVLMKAFLKAQTKMKK